MTRDEAAKLSLPVLRELVRSLHGAQVSWPAPRSTESLRALRQFEEALDAARVVCDEQPRLKHDM